ncbi:GNAT family N-acetyltransferase [Microlunatus sp. GCM10028923]|uniref:GNAT family N-acetyltransferase n=1 Tax=Microlunatus sp. GCM10028923 TaxID=3273400 RepID=UPI003670540E
MRHRIDQFWGEVFGGSTGAAVIVEHRDALLGYAGIYCVVRDSWVFVSAPGPMIENVRALDLDPVTAQQPDWWAERIPGWSVLGPSVHAFADEITDVSAPGVLIKAAGEDDLAELRGSVPVEEWAESGFAGDDVADAWVAVGPDGRAVAGANLTPFEGVPADVGVLSVPAVRGRGIASAVAAVASRTAVEQHGIARWRVLVGNRASRRIAARLGFEEDCRQLAVRPPD